MFFQSADAVVIVPLQAAACDNTSLKNEKRNTLVVSLEQNFGQGKSKDFAIILRFKFLRRALSENVSNFEN